MCHIVRNCWIVGDAAPISYFQYWLICRVIIWLFSLLDVSHYIWVTLGPQVLITHLQHHGVHVSPLSPALILSRRLPHMSHHSSVVSSSPWRWSISTGNKQTLRLMASADHNASWGFERFVYSFQHAGKLFDDCDSEAAADFWFFSPLDQTVGVSLKNRMLHHVLCCRKGCWAGGYSVHVNPPHLQQQVAFFGHIQFCLFVFKWAKQEIPPDNYGI